MTNDSPLPAPEHPFRNWCDLLPALWLHGVEHADPEKMAGYMHDFQVSFSDSFWPDPEKENGPYSRPSRGSQCPQANYYANVRGLARRPFPAGLKATFAMGHLAHAMAYGAIASALPGCFKLLAETSADVSNTIPEGGARTGTIDIIVVTTDKAEASRYIHAEALEAMPNFVGDFKTMTGRSWREHAKKNFEDGKFGDAFGQTGQLATYRFSPTVIALDEEYGPFGTLLISVNKESPQQGIIPRVLSNDYLVPRREHAQACYENKEDVGAWLLEAYGKDVAFYCGAAGRDGYCDFWDTCKKDRKAREALTVAAEPDLEV